MHEMSLCENLLRIIEESAETEQFSRVKTVFLEVGAFAGVEADAMQFCFEVVCRGTIADSSELIMTSLPVKARCLQCSQTVTLTHRLSPCPICQGFRLQYQGGDEIRITQLEVS
ncbi:hydrogenase maturation nickel metallochaperone HypA [Vibrio albus]|uniref:Hydrogenase maturation factor HypA n=1 Tax=Vibrio albus TaxID=2200953 RepID=A0A2U3BB01_9VIBR|nr:hydrogenase maturation nickel metallochaperone HypA [Vibrio albus]PWI33970.1 hydrogenase maturation nickel metallochaperone HypA [Vibrio albus]